jgi:hypothetical protein
MKKVLFGLCACTFVLGSAVADTSFNKTFFMPKSHNPNLAMESTTWHEQTRLHDEEKWGGTVQVAPFYEASTNEKDIGKYFGIKNPYASYRHEDYIWCNDDDIASPINSYDWIRYNDNDYISNLDANFRFRPNRETFGIRFDWHQKLDKLVDGLYFKIDLPVVQVRTSLGYTGSSSTQQLPTHSDFSSPATSANLGSVAPTAFSGEAKSFEDYLTGNLLNNEISVKQVALSHYKIHNGQTQTGLADLNFLLGYNLFEQPEKHFGINATVLVPLGNTPDGEYRFEAITGNGGHWGFGGGINTAWEIWKKDNKALDLSIVVDYKYLLKGTEKRTLNFRNSVTSDYGIQSGFALPWGPYYLGGQSGDTQATPLANFLTQDVDVDPGSQVDCMVDLTLNLGNWTFDLGYELFAKEEEKVSVKSWSDTSYGVADPDWNTRVAFITGDADSTTLRTIYRGSAGVAEGTRSTATEYCIKQADLLTNDAETPQKIVHKVFGGFGYNFSSWEYPVMFAGGASREFTSGNGALENWALWLKAGVTF